MNRFALTVMVLAAVTSSTAVAQQGTIGYTFGTGAGTLAPTSGSPTAGNISGGNFSTNSATSALVDAGGGDVVYQIEASQAAFSEGTSTFYSVTLTPTGSAVQLDSYSFDIRSTQATPDVNAYRVYARSGTGSFTQLGTAGTITNSFATVTNNTPGFSGNIGEAVEIRIYAYGAGTGDVDNIQLNNVSFTVTPVPEPATVGLMAAAGLGVVGLGRRLRRSKVQAALAA